MPVKKAAWGVVLAVAVGAVHCGGKVVPAGAGSEGSTAVTRPNTIDAGLGGAGAGDDARGTSEDHVPDESSRTAPSTSARDTADAPDASDGDAPGTAPDLGTSCNPYWWATIKCGGNLGCCRGVGAPPYVEEDGGISTPGYTCEQPGDLRFVCSGPLAGQPCDTNTASNDPLFCARGLSCCRSPSNATFTCKVSEGGDTCVL